MSDKFKYDLNLTKFVLIEDVDSTQLNEPLYKRWEGDEYRLGRYLMTADELHEAFHHRALCRYPSAGKEYLGVITGILASRGLWVVTLNDKVDIFHGQSNIRPVPS